MAGRGRTKAKRTKAVPNGAGSIRKNDARNRWEARIVVGFHDDGRPIRKMAVAATYDEAVAAMAALRERWETAGGAATELPHSVSAGSSITLGAFLDEWLDGLPDSALSPVTAHQYRTMVDAYIRPHLGRRPLDKLTVRDVEKWLRHLRDHGRTKTGTGVSQNTRRQARNVLSAALAKAVKLDLVGRNVARLADAPEGGEVKSGRTMTPDEVRRFLDAVEDHELGALYTLLTLTGMRRGEALGLGWDDLDLDGPRPTLRVRRSLKRAGGDLFLGDPKTEQSARLVRLPERAVAALRAHRSRQAERRAVVGEDWGGADWGAADLVFTDAVGFPVLPDRVYREMVRISEAAGLGKWTPHELRHTAASLMIAGQVPTIVVSKILGHASVRTTADVYSHLLDEAHDDAAAVIDQLVEKSSK